GTTADRVRSTTLRKACGESGAAGAATTTEERLRTSRVTSAATRPKADMARMIASRIRPGKKRSVGGDSADLTIAAVSLPDDQRRNLSTTPDRSIAARA